MVRAHSPILRIYSDGHSYNRDDSDGIQYFENFFSLHLVSTRKFSFFAKCLKAGINISGLDGLDQGHQD